MEAIEMFPDQDAAVLYDVYKQVGRNKQLLIEAMINGGEVPASARVVHDV